MTIMFLVFFQKKGKFEVLYIVLRKYGQSKSDYISTICS